MSAIFDRKSGLYRRFFENFSTPPQKFRIAKFQGERPCGIFLAPVQIF